MADSPLALETQGTTTSVLKVIVFCVAAAMASLAGALTGMLYQFAVGGYFESFNSITLVVLVVIITVGEPWYARDRRRRLRGHPRLHPRREHEQHPAAAVRPGRRRRGARSQRRNHAAGTAVAAGPPRRPANPDGAGTSPPLAAEAPAATAAGGPGAAGASAGASRAGGSGLEVRDLSVHFGGVKAVGEVTLTAPAGVITGLVGPNGAGKTTTFNACSGLSRPTAGQVLLHGADVSRDGAAERARRGLGRTFQRSQLFDSLTVRQNIAIGREAPMAGRNPLAQLVGSRRASRLVEAAAAEAHGPHRHCQAREYAGRPAPGRPAAPGRAGPGAGRAVRHAPARRAVVGARPPRDRGVRPGAQDRRARPEAAASCWSSTT